jgi:hypothetical protein
MEAKLAFRIAGGVVALGVVIIGLSAFAGGATTATVSGRVTMQGRPVIWGAVILVGRDGRSVAGRIQPDAPPVDRQQWFVLPKHYEDSRTSDLKLTVNRGRNEFDLTLAP